MKKWLIGLMLPILILLGWWYQRGISKDLVMPGGQVIKKELPYDKYQFEKLGERGGKASKIELGREIGKGEGFTSYMFYYESEGNRISGQLNMPDLSRLMAIVVMARGYVEKTEYKTGMGTRNAAAVYAQNGYITLAPDFSGYGESDPEDTNALGARLTKPVEILDLLASVATLPQADIAHVYLWGHSNGGQIMLSVAEIIGMGASLQGANVKGLTLWAPVTKPFPYSILYYTDEADDQGKWLRNEVAKFEASYDVYKYSLDKYWDKINIPLQLHQGTSDEAVPNRWSDDLVEKLNGLDKSVNYFEYLGADHNLQPGWNTVVARDLGFFAEL